MVCELFACDVASASVYDGPSALAEAALLALAHTKGNKVVVAGPVHPYALQVTRTYLSGSDAEMVIVPHASGCTDIAALKAAVDEEVAAVILQQPNFFGQIEDVAAIVEVAHGCGALVIASANPVAMALLEPPGAQGADIVVGEGQCLGNSMNLGGPALGLFGTTGALVRRLPGRVVGRTVDARGQDAYVLTLQTRKQHIRREKATSNICTNQSLNALASTVHLSLLGPDGLRQAAETSLQHAHYAMQKIDALEGYTIAYDGPFFNEFAVRCPKPAAEIVKSCAAKHRVLAGVDLGRFTSNWSHLLLIAVTEARTLEDLELLTLALDASR